MVTKYSHNTSNSHGMPHNTCHRSDLYTPSWEPTYTLPRHFWRWFSFSQGQIWIRSEGIFTWFVKIRSRSTRRYVGFPAWVICSLNSCHGSEWLTAFENYQLHKPDRFFKENYVNLEICPTWVQFGKKISTPHIPSPFLFFLLNRRWIADRGSRADSSMLFRNKTPKSCNKSCGPSILSWRPTTWVPTNRLGSDGPTSLWTFLLKKYLYESYFPYRFFCRISVGP